MKKVEKLVKKQKTDENIIDEKVFKDYLEVIKVTTDAYANIVKKMIEFQEKHKNVYERMSDLIDSPENVFSSIEKIKEINEEIFYRILEIMYKSATLSTKVRKLYYLSIDEKKDLVKNLNELSKDIEELFAKTLEVKKKMEAKK